MFTEANYTFYSALLSGLASAEFPNMNWFFNVAIRFEAILCIEKRENIVFVFFFLLLFYRD